MVGLVALSLICSTVAMQRKHCTFGGLKTVLEYGAPFVSKVNIKFIHLTIALLYFI